MIDELGAATDRLSQSDLRESLIATVRLEALASGSVNIRSEPAEATSSEVFCTATTIKFRRPTSPTVASASRSANHSSLATTDLPSSEDSLATTLDVLANDQIVDGTGTLSVVSVDSADGGGTVTSTQRGVVSFRPTGELRWYVVFHVCRQRQNGIQDNGQRHHHGHRR